MHRVLSRYGLAKLRWLDRPTGHVVRRIEPARRGDLVHIDVKKLGTIPAGGGWQMLGHAVGRRNKQADKSSGIMTKYRNPSAATTICTPRSTGTPGWPIRNCWPTSVKRQPTNFGSGLSLVHRVRDNLAKSIDRQRVLLSIPRLRRRPRRHRTPPHATVPATDQRQGRKVSPHPGRRMGLRPAIPK